MSIDNSPKPSPRLLQAREQAIAVWGLGYIGLTTAQALLQAGFRVIGIDTSAERCRQIRDAPVELNLETGFRVDLRSFLVDASLVVTSGAVTEGVGCHFVCIPTERSGIPEGGAISGLVASIQARWPSAPIILESTISPSWLQGSMNQDSVIVAPRRDWFHGTEHTVQALTRVVGVSSEFYREFAAVIIGTISSSIVFSPDKTAVAATKAFENAIWYLIFSFVDELAATQSRLNMAEVLRLARSNWRTPFELTPTLQVGGYCLPLASAYLSEFVGEAAVPLLAEARSANGRLINSAAKKITSQPEIKSVLILGLTYRPGLKVTANSAGSLLCAELVRQGLRVLAHDPLLSPEEVRLAGGGVPAEIASDLGSCECMVVCSDHQAYRDIDLPVLLESSGSLRAVYDCHGCFARYSTVFAAKGIAYHQLGTRSW